jgi:hypothetical protein
MIGVWWWGCLFKRSSFYLLVETRIPVSFFDGLPRDSFPPMTLNMVKPLTALALVRRTHEPFLQVTGGRCRGADNVHL